MNTINAYQTKQSNASNVQLNGMSMTWENPTSIKKSKSTSSTRLVKNWQGKSTHHNMGQSIRILRYDTWLQNNRQSKKSMYEYI